MTERIGNARKRRLEKALDRSLAVTLAALLLLMVLVVTWQVVSRYLLDDPSGWTEELARFSLIWIGLLGGAFAYHRRLHLGVDLLAGRLRSRSGDNDPIARWHARLMDGCVLVFAIAVLIVGGSSLVLLTLELEQVSPALGLPMGGVYASLPLSGVLIAISAVLAMLDPLRPPTPESDRGHGA